MTADEVDPDWEQVYGALAHPQRRTLLRYLRTAPGPVTVLDIATYLLAETGEEWSEDRLEGIQIGLYHIHLPKLLGADLIESDGTNVEGTPSLEQIPLETLDPTQEWPATPRPTRDPGPDEQSGLT